MKQKPIYIKPESNTDEYVLLQTFLEDSNTETFEGGGDDDITW